ncbi:MAG: hypothetical protein QME64_00160 [bacterium]|nr:hypothetical protein [bacterium]
MPSKPNSSSAFPASYFWDILVPGQSQGWVSANDLTPVKVARGILETTATGKDPYLISPEVEINATRYRYLIIRMKISAGTKSAVYFRTASSPGWHEDKRIDFSINPDNQFHIYCIPAYEVATWTGTVIQFRLDPNQTGEQARIAIDYILVTEKPGVGWHFGINNDAEGWTPAHSLSVCTVQDGKLATLVEGDDPYLIGPEISFSAVNYSKILLRVRVPQGNDATFYWTTKSSPEWDEAKHKQFSLIGENKFHTYEIDFNQEPEWKGTITQLRFDPPFGTMRNAVEIDYIWLIQRSSPMHLAAVAVTPRVVYRNEPIKITATIENDSLEPVSGIKLNFDFPHELSLLGGTSSTRIDTLLPFSKTSVDWQVVSKSVGVYTTLLSSTFENDTIDKAIPLTVCNQAPILSSNTIKQAQVYTDEQENIILENSFIRAVFIKNPFGYSHCSYSIYTGSSWSLVAVTAPLGSLSYQLDSGEQTERTLLHPTQYTILENNDGRASIQLVATFRDKDNADWKAKFTYTLESGKKYIQVQYSISANRDRNLLAFAGPALYVGERSFGANKDAGLFPGLEWLVDNEYSSSTIDIVGPQSARFVPHPYKITIPLMAIEQDKCLIGLLWDMQQKPAQRCLSTVGWDGKYTQPAAVFCSPNWKQGENNHRLGLFLPSIPNYIVENQEEAIAPYPLTAHQELQVAAQIVLDYPATILDIINHWIKIYGMPSLQRLPRSYEETLSLCRYAYMTAVWDSGKTGWGHAVGWNPYPYPGYAACLWIDSLLLQDNEIKKQNRERVQQAIDKLLKSDEVGAIGSLAGAHIPGRQLPFYVGHLEEALSHIRKQADEIIASQEVDGSWRFAGDSTLGKHGDTTIGTCAVNAWIILNCALLTGEEKYIQAGKKALQFMDQFSIPRGAQSWEVPLHTPDVLASARAVHAYLEGYKLTGNTHYLEQAKFWAKTGLPFIYFWGDAERPVMKYNSIPVFGATFYTVSWFAKPVIWNGLVYADALFHLSQYDQSFPWYVVAEGITRSGINQQYTEGKSKGCYPDSWDLIDNRAYPADINPENIMKNVFFLLGYDPQIHTLRMQVGKNSGWINSAASIQSASYNEADNILQFALKYYPKETSYVILARIPKPKQIKIENRILSEVGDIDTVPEGWRYLPTGQLLIKVLHLHKLELIIVKLQ